MGQGVHGGVQGKLEGPLRQGRTTLDFQASVSFEVAHSLPLYSKLHAMGEAGSGVLSLHSGLRLPRDGSLVGYWVLLHRLNHLRVEVECRSLLVTFLLYANAPNHRVS